MALQYHMNEKHYIKKQSFFKHLGLGKFIFYMSACALVFGCSSIPPSSLSPDTEYILPVADPLFEIKHSQISNSVPYRKIIPGDTLKIHFSRNPETADRFLLRPRDIIEVRFPEAPDLNIEQPIQPDGTISLPYINVPIKAAGITFAELNSSVKTLYQPILRTPEVVVIVKEYGKAVDKFYSDVTGTATGRDWKTKVSNDGYVSFPMLGEVFVQEKSIRDLRRELHTLYSDIVSDIRIDLVLEEASETWIFILGEVNSPGYYVITKPVSALEALAIAGGHTSNASLESALLIRRESDGVHGKPVDLKALLSFDTDTDTPFAYLEGNDLLYIPKSRLSNIAEVTRHVSDLLFFRGWSIGIGFNQDWDNF